MSDKARVVFDTNVLVSALLLPSSTAFRAYILAEQHCAIATSAELLAELAAVLTRPKFDRYVDRWARMRFLARIQSAAAVIVPAAIIRTARDPKDDIVLATAKSAQAQYLVTGDDDLLSLGVFGDRRDRVAAGLPRRAGRCPAAVDSRASAAAAATAPARTAAPPGS